MTLAIIGGIVGAAMFAAVLVAAYIVYQEGAE